ncbi:hypothetical protein DSM104329_02505 [Capillimicrobium parvum]|uniref:Uncharacterized protein n=1 Tax=Capillimicrobium parvum TaxID=2884022 RepID=A0A9E7C068_9ACTN|nr:hypothetical protein DSM104329_02505 [Capillimicrobium parvum]
MLLPAWLFALRDTLRAGALAPAEALGPITVLTELSHVCETLLAGRAGPNDADRKSITAELRAARGTIGPRAAQAIGPTLDTFVRETTATRLETAQGARSVKLALDALGPRVVAPEASAAAWDDVVAAFADPDVDVDICEQRMMVLRELCEARGHGWWALGLPHVLSDVISDTMLGAVWAGVMDESLLTDPRDQAGMDEEVRLAACRRMVAEDGERDDVVVWLRFEHAYVDGWQRVGPVEFFHAGMFPDGLRAGGGLAGMPGYEPPAELHDPRFTGRWPEDHRADPGTEHAVLARVRLPDIYVEQARRRARDLVTAVIEVASELSQWELQSGEVLYTEKNGASGSFFADPKQLERNRTRVQSVDDPTRDGLARLDPGLVTRLAADDPAAFEAVEDARWVIAVARSPSAAQRVALGTRALERSLGAARAQGERWPDGVRRYLRAPWLHCAIGMWLEVLAHHAIVGAALTHGRDSASAEAVVGSERGTAARSPRSVDVRGLASLASGRPLDEIISAGLMEHRQVRVGLAVLSDPTAAARWLATRERRFDVLLARAERCRNGVIHGQRPTEGALNTVDGFVADLGRIVARDSVRTAASGLEPLAVLEGWRVGIVEAKARLDAGDGPVEALFLNPCARGDDFEGSTVGEP